MKIYIASSWKNTLYPSTLALLEQAGHLVWDWRNPPTGGSGFKWQDCGDAYSEYVSGTEIVASEWRAMLATQAAQAGFASDLTGMNWCDVGVLLHPCGKSAHLEAGWIAGRGKICHVYAPVPVEADLMVLALNGQICGTPEQLLEVLQ